METINGIYKKTVYFNQGHISFFLEPDEETYKNDIKVVGKYPLQQEGIPLKISGEWRQTDFGKEFVASSIEEGCSDTEKTASFIAKLGIPINSREIKKLLKVTGNNLFELLEDENIEFDICDKTDIDEMTVAEIFLKLRSLKNQSKLYWFLEKYNASYDNFIKIQKNYPDDPVNILLKDAYEVYEDANIPFGLADKIALDNGVEPLSESRIRAMVLTCIRRNSGAGNTYMDIEEIYKTISKMYGDIPKSLILAALTDHKYIRQDKEHPDHYYEAVLMKDEKSAAQDFSRLTMTSEAIPWHPEFIDKIEEENGRKFGRQQKDSFQLLRSTGIKLLTGDPGTGKTTTMNGLLRYIEMVWKQMGKKPKFALCAPSGRASQRMKETTGRNALTVHKLLEYQPYGTGEYYKNANDPIDADVIVVDEVSMLGLSTFSKLMAAIKNGSLVLLIGDINQLQSVEPGSVLFDIVSSGYVDSCHLTEVFRQAKESLININAKKVISGDDNLLEGEDFKIVKCNPDETESVLENCVSELINEAGSPSEVQVLAPVKKGTCGIRDGNKLLQKMINPQKGGIWYGIRNYKVHDRIIMMANNYSLNYFNGDVGYIEAIKDSYMNIKIGDQTIRLPKDQYGDMDLAYNCTIHKSQGSEYDYLAIVLQEEAGNMLDRNLLYTGITRGKKKVVLIYENGCLKKSICTARKSNRNSCLVERIKKCLSV